MVKLKLKIINNIYDRRTSGKISYGSINIDDGGKIEGN